MLTKMLIGVACCLLLFNALLTATCGYETYVSVKNALNEEPPTLDVKKLQFDHYLKDFHKAYNGGEYNRRFENFKKSLKDIYIQNKKAGKQVAKLTAESDADLSRTITLDPVDSPKPLGFFHIIQRDHVNKVFRSDLPFPIAMTNAAEIPFVHVMFKYNK